MSRPLRNEKKRLILRRKKRKSVLIEVAEEEEETEVEVAMVTVINMKTSVLVVAELAVELDRLLPIHTDRNLSLKLKMKM